MASAGFIFIFASCLVSGLSQRDARTPQITGTPLKLTKDAGESVIMDCVVPEGEGNISVEWVKHLNEIRGQPKTIAYGEAVVIQEPRLQVRHLPNQKSIQIASLEPRDGGTYDCRSGNRIMTTVDLAIRSPPLILDSSTRNAIVREGDSGTLACFASGYPQPRIYWSRKEGISPHESKVTGNIIRISNVTRLDKGKYYCEAVNRLGRTSHVVDLDVVYPPAMLSTPTHAVIPEGATVKLACEADGSPVPQVYWSRDEGFSVEQAEATGEILRLTNITRKDSGSYHCLAINSLGESKLSSSVNVVYPPVLLDTSTRSVLVPEGGTAVLSCRSNGSPPPQVFWSREENFTAEGSVPSGEIVNITNATPSSRGRYFCLARNSLGEARHSINLEVEFSPIFLKPSSSLVVEEGEMAQLDCSALGYPEPRIYWSLNESVAYSNTLFEGPILTVESISRAHRGRYHCLARNDIGEAKKAVEVRVAFPPSFLNDSPQVAYEEGETGRLDCSADGFPAPNVYWGRSEDFQSRDATYKGNFYDIFRVSKHNKGEYYCLAENRLGQARKQISVEIKFKPKVYIPTPVTSAVVGGETALNCEVSGYPPPEVTWEKNNSDLKDDAHYRITESRSDGGLSKSTLLILNIEELHFGLYKCKGQNELGADLATVNLLQIQGRARTTQSSVSDVVPIGTSTTEGVTAREGPTRDPPNVKVSVNPYTAPLEPVTTTDEPVSTDPPKVEFVKIKIAVKKGGSVPLEVIQPETPQYPVDFPTFLSKLKSRFEEKQGEQGITGPVYGREEKLHGKVIT